MEFLDAKEEESRCGSTRATRGKGPYDEAHSRTAVRGSQEGRGRAVEGQVTMTQAVLENNPSLTLKGYVTA